MYDLLIKNGLVVDGSGDVPFLADVAVVGDSIAKIGHIDEPAKKVIDAQGKIVTPILLKFVFPKKKDHSGETPSEELAGLEKSGINTGLEES